MSQQRFLLRRLVLATVLAVGVFGAVRGVASLTDDKAAGESPSPTAGPGPSSDVVAAGAPDAASTTIAPTTTAPPATESERTGPPTADDPARVLVIGDSDAGTFGPYLQQVVNEWGIVDMELNYKVSSGLARPDFYNWPVHLREMLATRDPDIIVVTFGGNDAQTISKPCANGDGTCAVDPVVGVPSPENADEWTAEYVARVHEIVDIMVEDRDRTVIWVGIPNAADPDFTERLRIQDQAVRRALERYDNAEFVDTWAIFDGINGGIAELVVDPRTGRAIPVRASDGFHLNSDGADILAIKVSDRVRAVLGEMGADV